MAVLLPGDVSTMVAASQIAEGGVTEDNLRIFFSVFYMDLARFSQAVSPGTAARVNDAPRTARAVVFGSASASIDAAVVNDFPKDPASIHAAGERLAAPRLLPRP